MLGRLSKEDLAFYDGIAERIRRLLRRSDTRMSIGKLARIIGWNRSSLSSFLCRKTRTIQAHFLIRIAKGLNVPAPGLFDDRPDISK